MADTLGKRIKGVRSERGLGLRETAGKVGISSTFLSRVEHGAEKAVPSEQVIRRLAKILGDDFDALMHLAGRIPSDVAKIILSDPVMPIFLRAARAQQLKAEDLMTLLGGRKKRSRGA